MNRTTTTTEEAKGPDSNNAALPEFGRWRDVQRLFGIKRGTLYNLLTAGKIKSVLLRHRGHVRGCRLIHLASVRDYLNTLMAEQAAAANSNSQEAENHI